MYAAALKCTCVVHEQGRSEGFQAKPFNLKVSAAAETLPPCFSSLLTNRSLELAIDAFLERMKLDGDSWIQVSACDSNLPYPDSPESNGRSRSNGVGAGENSSHPHPSTSPSSVGNVGPVVEAKLRDFVQVRQEGVSCHNCN